MLNPKRMSDPADQTPGRDRKKYDKKIETALGDYVHCAGEDGKVVFDIGWNDMKASGFHTVFKKEEAKEIGMMLLDACFTLEPEPQKETKWLCLDSTKVKCSRCERILYISSYPPMNAIGAYCPSCGAKVTDMVEK